MKRRQFLKTVGAGAPAGLIVTGSSAKMNPVGERESKRRKEPRVFLFDDGRHAADLYCFEPPVTPADHAAVVDQLAGSGADTLVYFAGTEGGTVLFDSQVCQLWGDEVKKWTHYVWYRAAKILRQLIRDGQDPLKILCDRCRETGLFMIASAWVCVQGGTREKKRGAGTQVRLRHGQSSVSGGRGPGPEGIGRPGFCRWKRRPGKGPVQFPAPGGAAGALSALQGTARPIRNGRHRAEPDLGNALLSLRPGCRVGAGHDPVDTGFAQGGRRSRAKPGTAQAHLRPHPGSSGSLEVGRIPGPDLGVGKAGGRTLLREQPKRGGRTGSGCGPERRGEAHSRNRMPRLLRLSQWIRPAPGSIRHTLHDLGRRRQRLGPGGGWIRNRRPPLGSKRMALDGSRVRNVATAGASEIAGNRRQGLFGPLQTAGQMPLWTGFLAAPSRSLRKSRSAARYRCPSTWPTDCATGTSWDESSRWCCECAWETLSPTMIRSGSNSTVRFFPNRFSKKST